MRSIKIDDTKDRKDPRDCMKLATSTRLPESINKDEILIKVNYAGVNMPDVAQRKGFYPAPKGAPQVRNVSIHIFSSF